MCYPRVMRLVAQLAVDRSTALYRELAGDWAEWTPTYQVLTAMLNAARIANWQRTDDAGKTSPRHFPELLMPPGADSGTVERTRFGTGSMTIEQADDWLGWNHRGD